MDIGKTLDQIVNLMNDLIQYKEMISGQVGVLDKEVSVIYHEIEKHEYDVVSGFKMLVKLQEKLRIRRFYKYELRKVQSTISYCTGILPGLEKARLKIKKIEETASHFPSILEIIHEQKNRSSQIGA